MNKLLLSFIIPVYNVEKYLSECLDSIFDESADESEYEVIAVNDGSTDRSPEILKAYAHHHKNFRIITQENGGPSVARNTGIRTALGRYITFVDSDDFLLPDAVPTLLDSARQSDNDIMEFGHKVTVENSLGLGAIGYTATRSPMSGSGKAVFPEWLRQRTFVTVIWSRVYKRRLLVENQLTFRTGIMHEDDEWIYRCFFYADSVVFNPLAIYNYRRRDGSISSVGRQNASKRGENIVSFLDNLHTYKRCKDIFTIIDSLLDFISKIENKPENETFLNAMDKVLVNLYSININFLLSDASAVTAEKKKLVKELAKNRHLLRVMGDSKSMYLYWFLRIFPPYTALKLYNAVDKL